MTFDHVGIVAFADDVEVLLPITSDYKMAESKLRSLSPALIANQGTDIGEALEVALLSFSNNVRNTRNRVIILITDGEAHDSKALEVAEQASAVGLTVTLNNGVEMPRLGIGTYTSYKTICPLITYAGSCAATSSGVSAKPRETHSSSTPTYPYRKNFSR
jgi:hypothetical protein